MCATRTPPPARMFQKTMRIGRAILPRGQSCLQELEGPLRECPHVLLAIAVGGLERDGTLDRPGHREAGVTGRVAVAIARRPAGARLGETPGGPEQLTDQIGRASWRERASESGRGTHR